MSGEDANRESNDLAALGRDLELQRRRLDALAGLRDDVADLALTVHDLAQGLAAPSLRPSRALTWLGWQEQREGAADLAAAELLLRNLTSWLNSVFLRYSDAAGVLPECWLWHPDAIEELLCLWQGWRYAYAATSIALAADWHDRARPGVVRRLRALSSCSFESHAPGDYQRPTARTGATASDIGLVADWWTTDPHRPPPAPWSEQGEPE